MVQVLPYIPGIGEQIAPYLNQAINTLGSAFQQRGINQRDQRALSQLENPNLSPMEQIKIFGSLSTPKAQALSPVFQTLLKSQGAGQTQQNKTGTLLNSIDQMRAITDEGYTGGQFGLKTFGGPLRREAVQKRNQFDTYAITLEGYLRDLTTKGALPKAVFNELLNRLPSSKLSDRENIGRLDAIEDVIRNHSGKDAKIPSMSKDVKLKKVPKGTKLSQEDAASIFNQAGGDPEKARKIAKQLGYEWQ